MFDAIRHFPVFEHERSTDKSNCIPHNKSSLAGPSTALDDLIHEYFVRSGLRELLPKKSPKTEVTAEQRIKTHLRSLFWHFIMARDIDDDCYVRISLRDSSYRKSDPENPHNITIAISKVVSALEKHGFVQRRSGFRDRTTGRTAQTRIRPSLTLMDDLKTLPDDISEIYVSPLAVSIRHGDPTDLDPASARHLDQMEQTISAYNEFLRSHEISIPYAVNGKVAYLDKREKKRIARTNKKTLTAIYHADQPGTLTYGRIHGGWWQSIPSRFRRDILIDGEETVELDYSGQVPHIVAGLSGIQLTGDPYTLPLEIPFISAETKREVVKAVVVVALNASDRKSLLRGMRGKIRKIAWKDRQELSLSNQSLEPIIDAVLEALPYLEPYFLKGQGKQLFMHDAEIARQIIQTFLDQGKVVLSIHDGFVVQKHDEQLLRETMQKVWFEKFRTTIPIKTETKNT
jgi:hypothetical protein